MTATGRKRVVQALVILGTLCLGQFLRQIAPLPWADDIAFITGMVVGGIIWADNK